MKRIILVRHAKSSWEFDVIDHERPLNDRGLQDAGLVSKSFKELKINLDYVLCSDAKRTRSTASIFQNILNIEPSNIQYLHDLYDFSGELLTKVIMSCQDSINSLMVFGHNHAITAFVNSYGTTNIDNVPTSGLVIIEFEIDSWENLIKGKTIKTIFPKDLK